LKIRRGDTATSRCGDQVNSHPIRPSSRFRVPLITLLTDFGTEDYFVAAVKGVILSENPQTRIVDLTHDIPPHDIEAAAFTLLAACSAFPAGTIHVAVVDPGVGSSRRAILIQTPEGFFVGPDNGIFSYVYDSSVNAGMSPEVFHLTNTKFFRHPVSLTFNGRDVFAPVAAALSHGVKPTTLGTKTPDLVRLPSLKPETSQDGRITGRIIHIDRFGNCVTNISQDELTAQMIAAGATLSIKRKLVKSFRTHFAEETDSRDTVFGVWGSAGFLEIAVANDSAAKLLNVKRENSVIVN
jgi:S-adenosylmethionine hydrolase